MILNVEYKKIEPDIAVLEMTGRIITGGDSHRIDWDLTQLVQANQKKVVFDLTGVTFLDSSGIGILVMCHAKLKKAGGVLHIAGAQGMVEDTLKMTSVDKIIPLFPTLAEASRAFH